MRSALIVVLLLVMLPIPRADIGLSYDCYNSLEGVSLDITGEDLNFESALVMMPDTLSYKDDLVPRGAVNMSAYYYNPSDSLFVDFSGQDLKSESSATLACDSLSYVSAGTSRDLNGSYSQSMVHNGSLLESGAITDPGIFSWNAVARFIAKSSDDASDTRSEDFRISAQSATRNGLLKIHYGNPQVRGKESIGIIGGSFYERMNATIDYLTSKGSGVALDTNSAKGNQPSSSNSSDGGKSPISGGELKVMRHLMSARGDAKDVSIEAFVSGDTDMAWSNGLTSNSSGYSSGMGVKGRSNSSIDSLHLYMLGKATGFPMQILPPGAANVAWKEPARLKLNDSSNRTGDNSGDSSDIPAIINSNSTRANPSESYTMMMKFDGLK